MKKNLTFLVVLFLVFIVSYGGSGVNIMVYCCGICQEKETQIEERDICCGKSGHFLSDEVDSHICIREHSFPCGSVTRISFDWNFSVSFLPILAPGVIDLTFISDIAALTPLFQTENLLMNHCSAPPLLYPRLYLSILNQLLI